VFGRVRPFQKLAAIKALQAAGHVVAMIGDGVNDVQALKQADLGIAMGSGSDASRSVARVVLLDGTFAAVPQLLDEARRVIANIERVAGLFVAKTAYAAIIAVIVGATAIPFPFYPRHLTVVSTLAIGVPGFFLALAAGAPRARPGFTRRVLAFTIPAGTAAAAATLGSYALARAADGTSPQAARTAAMLALPRSACGSWASSPATRHGASPWSPRWPPASCRCSPSPWRARPSPCSSRPPASCPRWPPSSRRPSRDSPYGAASARPADARARPGGTTPPFGMTDFDLRNGCG
jgi:magnesium-transporting ATPase (P-type)